MPAPRRTSNRCRTCLWYDDSEMGPLPDSGACTLKPPVPLPLTPRGGIVPPAHWPASFPMVRKTDGCGEWTPWTP